MKTVDLGKVVVEPGEDGRGFLAMMPDGEVVYRLHPDGVAAFVGRWQSARTPKDGIAVLTIEWRGCKPDGGKR